MPLRVLAAKWDHELAGLATICQDEFVLVSPYLTQAATSWLLEAIPRPDIEVTCLTDLSPRVLLQGTQTEAIRLLAARGQVYHLAGLHAKVFVADRRAAIVTSGNLTDGGTRTNFEVGLYVDERDAVEEVYACIRRYIASARKTNHEELAPYLNEVDRAREARVLQTVSTAVADAYRKAVPIGTLASQVKPASIRPRGGLRVIFREAILAEIHLEGPQPVERLYEVIQSRHPVFCDDRITRGQPPRPLWRHEVRFALEELKEDQVLERIELIGKKSGLWGLTSRADEKLRPS